VTHRVFRDRREAGRLLGEELSGRDLERALVLGIPRGGVIVGEAIAEVIDAELDVALVRKLRAPRQPELAIGAVSEDGRAHVDDRTAKLAGADEAYIERERREVLQEIERRAKAFREVRPRAEVGGRSVIIADDGLATGATMMAAVRAIRDEEPKEIIAAAPVGSTDRVRAVAALADRVVCLSSPQDLRAVGQAYESFDQVEDAEAVASLRESFARSERAG